MPAGGIGCNGLSPGSPGVAPWQYDVNTIATCVGPFPVRFTVVGVTVQLKYCGAFDVQPSVIVSFTGPDTTSPTTIFPPGFVVTVVAVPPDVVSMKFAPALNVAVTVIAAFIVTVHVPVPLQPPPLHPKKLLPDPAVAVNVTCVPLAKLDWHSPSGKQSIPSGELTTVPLPVPASAMVSVYNVLLKVAVTDSAVVMSIVQVPVPPHPDCPVQPANVDPDPGAAVSVTCVPLAKFAEHPLPQLIPAGELTTVPVPLPLKLTVNA
jgi:hypothetical protein